MTKRKLYSAEFKAKEALEAIREELTTAELAKKYGIHPTMISGWKRTVIENMAAAFNGQATAEPTISAAEVEKLHVPLSDSTCLHVRQERSGSWSWNGIFCRKPPVSSSALEAKSGEERPS
ncbi:transposase (plasmid) [Antarctobacter heliothermus]|uniref:Transposase n=1 Tax=Antarctobacter heliothermus TaxID=74033 RepID=A0A222EC25_9RHOB|nr:transposase [Antarctobacter heliothermus]